MYDKLATLLNHSAEDDNIHMCVVTGAGDFFSSGTDTSISIGQMSQNDSLSTLMGDTTLKVKRFIDGLITYPKLLIAIVNGPAIGIAATMLGIFDMVYASDKAYFWTPFSALDFTAEGCSTYTFPRIMGHSKAGDMLYLGYKMHAAEAKQRGFISRIYQENDLNALWSYLKSIAGLSLQSIKETKSLIKRWNESMLLEVNSAEVDTLIRRFKSPNATSNRSKL